MLPLERREAASGSHEISNSRGSTFPLETAGTTILKVTCKHFALPLEPFRANFAQARGWSTLSWYKKRSGFKTTCKNGGSSSLEWNGKVQKCKVPPEARNGTILKVGLLNLYQFGTERSFAPADIHTAGFERIFGGQATESRLRCP
jgi:hypothetical protein